jgi:hypothetical protein
MFSQLEVKPKQTKKYLTSAVTSRNLVHEIHSPDSILSCGRKNLQMKQSGSQLYSRIVTKNSPSVGNQIYSFIFVFSKSHNRGL